MVEMGTELIIQLQKINIEVQTYQHLRYRYGTEHTVHVWYRTYGKCTSKIRKMFVHNQISLFVQTGRGRLASLASQGTTRTLPTAQLEVKLPWYKSVTWKVLLLSLIHI